jgi:hypothetical protein
MECMAPTWRLDSSGRRVVEIQGIQSRKEGGRSHAQSGYILALLMNEEPEMRIEKIESGPGGTRLIVALNEDEGRELNVGLEAESHAWQVTLRDRVREAHTLDGVRQLQAALESSRQELAELRQTEQNLRDEWRKLLETGSAANAYEKKLAAVLTNAGTVQGRIRELERLLATRTSLAGSEIAELQTDLMHELYGAQEQERVQLEAAFFSVAGDLVKKLVRHRKLAEARGHNMQRFRRMATQRPISELVKQLAEAGPL